MATCGPYPRGMGTTHEASAGAMGNCPECRSAGSISQGVCQVCFAEIDERVVEAFVGPVRFADVIAELEAVAWLAGVGAAREVAEACRRARMLMVALKEQFVDHVVLAPVGAPPVPELEAPIDPEATPVSV